MTSERLRMKAQSIRLVLEPQLASLESLLDEEIAALEHARFDMLEEFSRRKSRALSAFTRAMENLPMSPGDADLKARARRVRDKLDADARLLRLHLSAVEEVAEVLVAALEDGEWDGTYQQFPARTE